ncbi:hypothetical protein [Protofrankia coriariae]|uniref:hypothetical protein n=1 Tax=Protofrankia coriariae TaxID=1562887 RepID=UPI000B2809AA|nr:hypothetical protein [Protofrankia coriariae]
MASTPTRAVNLTRQLIAIRATLPTATGRVRRGELDCLMCIRPSPASQVYTVRLLYRHGRRPRITVTDPQLTLRPDAHALPHVYAGDELCLYYPGEWRHDMLLSATILPWIAEWLIHYELWLISGHWVGGGSGYTYIGTQDPGCVQQATKPEAA